jgi:hypothetical protein
MILGADILIERSCFSPITATLERHLLLPQPLGTPGFRAFREVPKRGV